MLSPVQSKTGWLSVQSGALGSWKRRWYSLRGDKLWASDSPDQAASGQFDLDSIREVDLAPDCAKQPAFKYTVATDEQATYLLADSLAECVSWVSALRRPKPPTRPVGMSDFEVVRYITLLFWETQSRALPNRWRAFRDAARER
jgi:hypothetical protein